MDAALANRLAVSVRAADPDRYFSALFAPSHTRPYLFALYAFNHEVARVAETVREPMLGAIRLEWWRETVESAHAGAPRNHDVARGLAALFQSVPLTLADFEPLIVLTSGVDEEDSAVAEDSGPGREPDHQRRGQQGSDAESLGAPRTHFMTSKAITLW